MGVSVLVWSLAESLSLTSGLLNFPPENTFRKKAPQFELSTPEGEKVGLEGFRGRWVVLHFWASWCPPCLEEIPEWLEAVAFFKNRPVQWIAISLDSSWSEAFKVLPSLKPLDNLIFLLDSSAQVANQYGSFQFPETYLLDHDLKVAFKWVGPQNWAHPDFLKQLEQLMEH